MNIKKHIFSIVMLALLMPMSELSAKGIKVPAVYMFGVAASFQDSVVYITDVQKVDSVCLDQKNGFLLGRDSYSYQLRDYFTDKQQPYRVCIVLFAVKRADAEKKYLRIRKKYTQNPKKKYDVKYINATDFKFEAVDVSTE